MSVGDSSSYITVQVSSVLTSEAGCCHLVATIMLFLQKSTHTVIVVQFPFLFECLNFSMGYHSSKQSYKKTVMVMMYVIALLTSDCCLFQLYRASALFETIRHEAQHSTDYKLSLFDLQTSCYQALQRVLVSLGVPINTPHILTTSCPQVPFTYMRAFRVQLHHH